MDDHWKTEVSAHIGTNVFFLETLGPIMGSIARTNEGGLFILSPRAVGPQGLGRLPGLPDKVFLLTKPLYIWPVKAPDVLAAYTKSTTGLILVNKISPVPK
jgi:hypothetical protein